GPGRGGGGGPVLVSPGGRGIPRPAAAAKGGGAGMRAADARVLLTGASGGIGRPIALALREAGASVMGVGRAADSPLPAGTSWVRADLTTVDGLAAVAGAAAGWRANVVVHAAGAPAFGPLADTPPAQMQAVLQANLLAPMLLTQALLPQLQRMPKAQVGIVGSSPGRSGLPRSR